MGIGIEHLSADDYTKTVVNDQQNYVSDDLILMRDGVKVKRVGGFNVPYRVEEGRVLRITQGTAVYQINMIDYPLKAYDVVITPPDSIIMVKEMSGDFNLQAMSIKDLGEDFAFNDVLVMPLANDDWQRISEYVTLLWNVVHVEGFKLSTVHYLQMALLDDLLLINEKTHHDKPEVRQTRVQHTFSEFVRLVNQYGSREHRIAFYADKLFLTPNRLSTFVKEQSGETAMQWINRAIILEAKVLLRHSDLKNYEIAERLNFPNASFFNKFFRKQTGMTPLEYKEG